MQQPEIWLVNPSECLGLEAGHYMITNEFIAEVLRSATRGMWIERNGYISQMLILVDRCQSIK